MPNGHQGPVVLISGANGGIGTATALELLPDHCLSLGARSPHGNPVIRQKIEAGEAHSAHFSAEDERAGDDWVATVVSVFGRIDAVINCIGMFSEYRFTDPSFDELDRLINVNLKAPIRAIRAAYPHLSKAPNPKIINLISLSGLRVRSEYATGYAISKFALRALGQSVKQAGWERQIRVTSLFPGWVNTKMAAGRGPIAPEAMTQPEDVAKIIRLLLALPPTCSISELAINCLFEQPY